MIRSTSPARIPVECYYREVHVEELTVLGEFSHAEIAAFLGAPVQTVKNRLHASRKRLKKELIDMTKSRRFN